MKVLERCIALFIFMILNVGASKSQSETSDFARIGHAGFLLTTVSDYQCVGVNPANLGFVPEAQIFQLATPMQVGSERRRKDWAFSILEGGFSAHSDALSRGALVDVILQQGGVKFTPEQKIAAARAFSGNGIRFNVDVFNVGASYQTQGYGGIALTIRERATGTFLFNDQASKLIFEGRQSAYFDSLAVNWNGDTVGYSKNPKNFSDLFDGSVMSMLWFREYAASYGLKIIDIQPVKIYAGATVKFLESYAYLDARVENTSFVGKSSLSPFFGINYGKATTPSVIPGSSLDPVGTGWGLDLGVTVEIGRWSFSASVVDMGKFTFNGNVFNARDTILNGLSSSGFDSYNIFNEAQKITGDGEFFSWEGLQTASTELPTRFKAGISYFYDYRWRFGIDVAGSVNKAAGSIAEPVVSGGVDFRVTPWCTLSMGLGGGSNMGVFVPLSALFSAFDGFWEMGFTSRDLVTYLISKQPVVSLAVGFMRFRI